MRKLSGAIWALACLVLIRTAGAQDASELIQRHLAAVGGTAALETIATVRLVQDVTEGDDTYQRFVFWKQPSFYLAATTANNQIQLRGFDGQRAWEAGSLGRIGEWPSDLATLFWQTEGTLIGHLVMYQEAGLPIALEGQEVVGGRPAYKLKVMLSEEDVV